MTTTREDDVVMSFVQMAGSLTGGDDVTDLLGTLVQDCARLLDVAAAGLLLADRRGALHVLAASSEQIAHVEAFQAQRGQGPCHDCYSDGRPVNAPDLAADPERWPAFTPVAVAAGVASVHAVPLRLRTQVLGALGLFGSKAGDLNDRDLRLAQGLADVATIAMVQDAAVSDRDAVNTQLQTALESRIVLEQAKGILAHSGKLDMAGAYAALRGYARDHNLKLPDLARSLVDMAVPADLVLDHARAKADTRRR